MNTSINIQLNIKMLHYIYRKLFGKFLEPDYIYFQWYKKE